PLLDLAGLPERLVDDASIERRQFGELDFVRIVAGARVARGAAMLATQPQQLEILERWHPRSDVDRWQSTECPESLQPFRGVGLSHTCRQSPDAGRIDERHRAVQFQVDPSL